MWHERDVTSVEALKRSAREPGCFAVVYEAHSRAILAFLARRTWDPEVALELTAETFARAFAGARKFRGTTDDEVRAWLYGIARHVLSHFVRRGKIEARALHRLGVDVPPLEADDHARIVELAGLAELREQVARSFAELSDEHREAVRLRVVEELPYPEVAAHLRVTEETARARVSRGLRRLAAMVEKPAAEGAS